LEDDNKFKEWKGKLVIRLVMMMMMMMKIWPLKKIALHLNTEEDPPEHEGSILPLFSSDMIHHSNRICEQEYVALLLILILQTHWLGLRQLRHHLHC